MVDIIPPFPASPGRLSDSAHDSPSSSTSHGESYVAAWVFPSCRAASQSRSRKGRGYNCMQGVSVSRTLSYYSLPMASTCDFLGYNVASSTKM